MKVTQEHNTVQNLNKLFYCLINTIDNEISLKERIVINSLKKGRRIVANEIFQHAPFFKFSRTLAQRLKGLKAT